MDKYDKLGYSLEASCSNCNWHGSIQIPTGVTVGQQNCPNCGCNTIHKVSRPTM